jgi:hypothetical protein
MRTKLDIKHNPSLYDIKVAFIFFIREKETLCGHILSPRKDTNPGNVQIPPLPPPNQRVFNEL